MAGRERRPEDPRERQNLAGSGIPASGKLRDWQEQVTRGLNSFDDLPVQPLDEDSIERLRALGYVD